MGVPRCLICRKSIQGRPRNPWSPFCGERCKLIDLGKWLGEEYRVPVAPPQEGDEQGEGAEPPLSPEGEDR
jgi:endogenous inhibitor of DNA gyrase (YacG/DUF329 family)